MTGFDQEDAPGAPATLASLFTIGDMARKFGITLRALRFYEDRGLLLPLRHGTTRFYDAQACRRVELILRAKQFGYTLTEIAALIAREGEKGTDLGADATEIKTRIDRLARKREELDRAIEELRNLHRQAGHEGKGISSAA